MHTIIFIQFYRHHQFLQIFEFRISDLSDLPQKPSPSLGPIFHRIVVSMSIMYRMFVILQYAED